jgi:hypothetical protein
MNFAAEIENFFNSHLQKITEFFQNREISCSNVIMSAVWMTELMKKDRKISLENVQEGCHFLCKLILKFLNRNGRISNDKYLQYINFIETAPEEVQQTIETLIDVSKNNKILQLARMKSCICFGKK